MKISIVILLLIIVAILLGISIILQNYEEKFFNNSLGRTKGVYSYINTSCYSFQKLNKCIICRRILEFLSSICVILTILILLVF